MSVYDWQNDRTRKMEREDRMAFWPTIKANRALNPNDPAIFTEAEMELAQDRYRMGRELSILEQVDYISFWLEFMKWYEAI